MAQILDGRALAARIREKMKQRISTLATTPGLAVLLIGSDPASHLYVDIKQKACEEVGIHFEKFLYSADASEETLLEKIQELNQREDIHGILVQLPLPTQNASRVIAQIDPQKDVDGFHPENVRRLKAGEPCIASAVALGVMKLIDEAFKNQPARSDHNQAVIVSSPLFAEPLITILQERNLQAVVTQVSDPEFTNQIKTADILIVAVGKPGIITGDMLQPGVIIIDVGTTKINGVLFGDVDFDSVEPVASAITPVPGGVGPMTVAMLLVNVLKAYDLQLRKNLKE